MFEGGVEVCEGRMVVAAVLAAQKQASAVQQAARGEGSGSVHGAAGAATAATAAAGSGGLVVVAAAAATAAAAAARDVACDTSVPFISLCPFSYHCFLGQCNALLRCPSLSLLTFVISSLSDSI